MPLGRSNHGRQRGDQKAWKAGRGRKSREARACNEEGNENLKKFREKPGEVGPHTIKQRESEGGAEAAKQQK